MIKRLRRLLTRGAFDPQEVDLSKVVRDVVRIASAQAAGPRRETGQQPR